MKLVKAALIFFSLAMTLAANEKIAKSSECKQCHQVIYDEYKQSMHQNSTVFKDPIHNAVWSKHPANKKKQKYVCGKCHTPAADNLSAMLGKGSKAIPDSKNESQNEAVSCAYCHRIESIKHGKKTNTNMIGKKERHYYGTLNDAMASDFHTLSSGNKNFQNGNVCMGCHSHKANNAGLNVCSTNSKNEMDKANCVSCHMPKVEGSVSSVRKTAKHSFHGFPGAHAHHNMLAKYVTMNLAETKQGFSITVKNHSPHALLLHPLRQAQLRVTVLRGGKQIQMKAENFVRVIGKNGKPTPPWVANQTVKDTMIQGDEKRTVTYQTKLKKGDTVVVTLGNFLVKPKALKKFGLDKNKVATKFYTIKKERFTIK